MNMKNRKSGTFRGTVKVLVGMGCLAMLFFGFMSMANFPVSANDSSPAIRPPRGLSISGPAEVYTPDTLYEKINGQAEHYLSAGFLELNSQWYEWAGDAGKMIEMNVFNMGSLLNAFSVYSQQLRHDAQKINIAQFAYQTQSAVFLVHGSFYVEILPSEFSDPMSDLAKQLAEQFIKATRVEDVFIKELDYFPPENLDKDSITIIAKDAFGMNHLDNVFMATYTFDGYQLTAYLADRQLPMEAKRLVNEVHGHFMGFGGSDVTPDLSIEGARMIMVMDNYELIFSIGPYLVGIHEASTRKQAEKLGERMYKSLQERL